MGKEEAPAPLSPVSRVRLLRELNPELIDRNVLIPINDDRSSFVLGPTLKTLDIPPDMAKFYPGHKKDEFLYQQDETDISFWDMKRPVRSWPTAGKDFINWLDRVEEAKMHIWKYVGIYDAIQFSRINIPTDCPLLGAAFCFWSISSNSFHFNFGMMSPTILDVAALIGLKPHGEEVSAILDAPNTFDFDFSKLYTAYSTFISTHNKTVGPVDDKEHVAFLLTWICRYLLCSPSCKVVKEHLKLAVALAQGRQLALAPFVLSHLYRGCHDLIKSKFGNSGGPFWILQFWLYAYFPELGHEFIGNADTFTYGSKYTNFKIIKHTFKERFTFFYSKCTSRTPSQFMPFHQGGIGPSWFQNSIHPAPDGENLEQFNIWASYLIARDLHFNLVVEKVRNKKCGVEIYAPNQLARQFGLVQAVPAPLIFSGNGNFYRRETFTSIEEVAATHAIYYLLKRDFIFEPFKSTSLCTKQFDEWWLGYISIHRSDSVDVVLNRITPSPEDVISPISPWLEMVALSESTVSRNPVTNSFDVQTSGVVQKKESKKGPMPL